ncbi:MAG: hypothetical protein ABIR31_08845 [Ginsengibacter sp.]
MKIPRTFLPFFHFAILIIFYLPVQAQVPGGNPPSLKWQQINTPNSRVIFSKGLSASAGRISNIINEIAAPTSQTIGTKKKKINIVLQNQTTVSNAYVGLGPFRSEFFITQPQGNLGLGSLPWIDLLTIHEYRHVQQFNNFNVGLSKVMRDIFGEEGQSLANNAAIPNWFYEGDAVYNETNLSKQGRGSLPSFYGPYRSLWKDNRHYNWMKLRNGSLKDFIPDHYALGFLMVAYGHQKYGDEFWKNVTHDAASFKSLIYPFQAAIKKYSGVNYVKFRNDALDFFKNQFADSIIIAPRGNYKNEQFVYFKEDGSLIYLNNSFKKIPTFIEKSGNEEKKIRGSDYTINDYFSYRNGKIVYASFKPDARWGYRDFSNIGVMDISSGKQHTITHRGKYFSPDINNDGNQIVAVEELPDQRNRLVILNSQTGEVSKILPNKDSMSFYFPKFKSDSKIIAPVHNSIGQMSIAEVDVANSTYDYLLPFTFNVVAYPYIHNDTLYFTLNYKKNVDLFAYTFMDKKIWQIDCGALRGIGVYHPTVSDSKIAFSTLTSEGYRIQQVAKNQLKYTEIGSTQLQKITSSFGTSAINGLNSNLLYNTPDDSFAITKYHKAFKLFNFHSVEPAADDPQYTLSLISENILNTLESSLSYTFDRSEKFHRVGFSATYSALFPFLTAGINYTFDRKFIFHNKPVYFNQLEPFAGFNVPLNLSKGRSFTYVNFGSQFVYNTSYFRAQYKDTFGNQAYNYISNFLSFSSQLQKAAQAIYPRLAQAFSISYKLPVTKFNGYQVVTAGNLYFPGIINTHSIQLVGAYLKKDSLHQLNFSSGFPFSRGYTSANFYEMTKWGVNYHFPLLFPDAGFANIFYLLRVRMNLFYDETRVKDFYTNGNIYRGKFRSAGTELNFDGKIWNQADISFGIRYSYLLDKDLYGNTGNSRWDFIVPVYIFNK